MSSPMYPVDDISNQKTRRNIETPLISEGGSIRRGIRGIPGTRLSYPETCSAGLFLIDDEPDDYAHDGKNDEDGENPEPSLRCLIRDGGLVISIRDSLYGVLAQASSSSRVRSDLSARTREATSYAGIIRIRYEDFLTDSQPANRLS